MRSIQDYLALPYTMIVRWDGRDSIYVARVKEIDGCTGHGETAANALDMLKDNLEDWISDCLETGDDIPIPDAEDLPSGKWVQRVPKSLHRRLSECAEAEGVSLNQLVVSYLSEAIGKRHLEHVVVGQQFVSKQYDGCSVFPISPYAINTQIARLPFPNMIDDPLSVLANVFDQKFLKEEHIVLKTKREEAINGYQETETLYH